MSSDLQFLASLLSALHLTIRPRIKAAAAVLPMDHWPGTALISNGMSGVTEN